ncbi:hypothetical protein [Candidatus Palauibacter sp.]|uniref:hypothetical protein n=1 Tax=Candidatus Palauibacter sp. TaxID=3101350 RepID=UPI003B016A0C
MRALGGLAALTLTGLAVAAAYMGLRSLGLRPRWEVAAPAASPAPELESRMPPPLSPQGVASGAPGVDGDGDPSPSEGGRAPAYEPARIEFETYGDGRPVESNSAVAEGWRDQGLVLSFQSYTADATRPHVLDARGYLPPTASMHALGPPLSGEQGLEVGMTHLDFPGRPRRAAFSLFGPDLIESFLVIVWSGGERLPEAAATHSPDTRYGTDGNPDAGQATYSPGGRARFRAERVVVEVAAGIDRISLDGWGPPGHILLLDHLEIDP